MMRSEAVFTCQLRPICLMVLLCGFLLPADAWGTEIPEGTHLLLRMVNSISTRTAQPGDYYYMRTASPVSVNDRIVVPISSYVQGKVTFARRGGKVSGRAQLGLRLETLTLPNGRTLKFSPSLSSVDPNQSGQKLDRDENLVRQGPNHGRDAARIVVTAGSGAFLGAIVDSSVKGASIGAGVGGAVGLASVMISRGREVVLQQGSSIDVVLDRPLIIQ